MISALLEEIIVRDEGREGVVESTDHRGGRWINNEQRERESVSENQEEGRNNQH